MFMIGMTGNYVYSDRWGWDDESSKELRNILPFEFTRGFPGLAAELLNAVYLDED
jgi:putative flippase GtrA